MSFLSEVIPLSMIRGTTNGSTRSFNFNYDLSGLTTFRITFNTPTSAHRVNTNGIPTNELNEQILSLNLPLNINTGVTAITPTMTTNFFIGGSTVATVIAIYQFSVNFNRSINMITLNCVTVSNGFIPAYACFAINGTP